MFESQSMSVVRGTFITSDKSLSEWVFPIGTSTPCERQMTELFEEISFETGLFKVLADLIHPISERRSRDAESIHDFT